jgi:hypothetical protein
MTSREATGNMYDIGYFIENLNLLKQLSFTEQ